MHTSTCTYSKNTRWNTYMYYRASQTEVAVGVESSHCGRNNQTTSVERCPSTWGRDVHCGVMWLAKRLAGRKRRFCVGLGRWASCGGWCGHQWPSEARFKGIKGQGSHIIRHQIVLSLLVYFLIPFWTVPNRFFQQRNDVGGIEVIRSIGVRQSMLLALRDKKWSSLT